MATQYVRYAGTTGVWASPQPNLATALAAAVAGDTIYVASDHTESQASAMNLVSTGTATNPCQIICVTPTAIAPVSADLANMTLFLSTTGAFSITLSGVVSLCQGLNFSVSDTSSVAHFICGQWNLKNCFVKLNSTGSSCSIRPNSTSGIRNIWENTILQFSGTGQGIAPQGGSWTWKNTLSAIAGATLPSNLFNVGSIGLAEFIGVDLSALSGKILAPANMSAAFNLSLVDCKLPSSFAKMAAQNLPLPEVVTVRSSGSAINYDFTKDNFYGRQAPEPTVFRTSGATDGTTPISIAIVTTANAKWNWPFRSTPISRWNDTVGAVTVTVFGAWPSGTVPNNDDIWIECEYLGSSSFPQGSFFTTTKADVLATGTATTSDGSSWATSPGISFKMVAVLSPSPGMKGPINVRVCAAKASQTFYIDPKIQLT